MRNKTYLIIVSIIVLIAGAVCFLIWKQISVSQASPGLNAFAKCLADKGAVMYGTQSCSWCQKQEAGFKSAWQYINYTDCFKEPNKCVAEKIEGTPTWIFPDGKRLVGYQPLENLSKESGCPLQ